MPPAAKGDYIRGDHFVAPGIQDFDRNILRRMVFAEAKKSAAIE
jgi:hypothetical protein